MPVSTDTAERAKTDGGGRRGDLARDEILTTQKTPATRLALTRIRVSAAHGLDLTSDFIGAPPAPPVSDALIKKLIHRIWAPRT